MNRNLIFWALLWLLSIMGGFHLLNRYNSTPGILLQGPAVWPVNSLLTRDPHQATLVIFAHPYCPCTRASLREMSRLVSHLNKRVRVYVVFLDPLSRLTQSGPKPELLSLASTIPDVHIVSQGGQREASLFHTTVSGQVLMYDNAGLLRFNGGITPVRGHEGDSVGYDSLLVLLNQQKVISRHAPVFGCPLFNPTKP